MVVGVELRFVKKIPMILLKLLCQRLRVKVRDCSHVYSFSGSVETLAKVYKTLVAFAKACPSASAGVHGSGF